MSLDLRTARAAYKSRVLSLPELEMAHEDELPPGAVPGVDEWGTFLPYAILHFGRPVPNYGRTLGDGEADYPHLWPTWVELVTPAGYSINDLADALDALMIGWAPDGDNSTGLRGAASYSYARKATENMPARKALNRYFTCLVNMTRA